MNARAAGRLVTALLKGQPTAPLTTLSREEIVERRASDDAVALAVQATLPRRVLDAVAEDAVAVILPDGSSLDVAGAERQLAGKEEDGRVFRPLRVPLLRARAPFRRFADRRHEWRQAFVLDEPVAAEAQTKLLTDFLASTNNEVEAALAALASLGGAAAEDDVSFARAIDLPGLATFTDKHLGALVKQVLPALPRGSRGLVRVPAPRALCGHVVADDDAVRLWTAPTSSAGRFWATARGAGAALADAASIDDASVAAVGAGLALALVDAEARRKGCEESAVDARRATRVVVATAFLLARCRAAAALVVAAGLSVDEEREVVRDRVRGAVSVDVGFEFASSLLLAPLPDGRRAPTATVAIVDEACAAVAVAGSWLWLREHLDVGFLLRPRSLEALRELPVVFDAPHKAWLQLFGELL